MITILSFLARFSIIAGLMGIVFSSVSDFLFQTAYLQQMDDFIDMTDTKIIIIIGLLALIYLIIFFLATINKITKYSQNKKIKSKTGDLEVPIKTINEVAKDYLVNQDIIKNTKVKSYSKGRGVVIEAIVDAYNMENLSGKLLEIQVELSNYVESSVGITVKKSSIKLKKVLNETIIEKKIIDSPAIQKEEEQNASNKNKILKNKNNTQIETSPTGKEN